MLGSLAAGRDRLQSGEERDEIHFDEKHLVLTVQCSGLDQNGRCAPGGEIIAECGRRPFVAVAGDVAGNEFLERKRHRRCDAAIAVVTMRSRLRLITIDDEKRDCRLPLRSADRRQSTLIV